MMWNITTKIDVRPKESRWLSAILAFQIINRINMEIKKTSLWIGVALSLIAVCVIFPIEKTDYLDDLVYTPPILSVGFAIIIYAISGGNFLKVVGFLLGSILISMFFWFLVERGEWGALIAVIWGGIPSGLISGILFLIGNYYLKLNEKKSYRYVKQLLFYFLILLIVSVLFNYGGDWYYYIFEKQ